MMRLRSGYTIDLCLGAKIPSQRRRSTRGTAFVTWNLRYGSRCNLTGSCAPRGMAEVDGDEGTE